MARWTQYIGLSKEACEFLKQNNVTIIGKWKMTQGIDFDYVMGNIYQVTVSHDMCPSDWVDTYLEVEYITPWSSGPMIRTALRNAATGEICFKWKDEDVHQV